MRHIAQFYECSATAPMCAARQRSLGRPAVAANPKSSSPPGLSTSYHMTPRAETVRKRLLPRWPSSPAVAFAGSALVWVAAWYGMITNPRHFRDSFLLSLVYDNPKGEASLQVSVAALVLAFLGGIVFLADRRRRHRWLLGRARSESNAGIGWVDVLAAVALVIYAVGVAYLAFWVWHTVPSGGYRMGFARTTPFGWGMLLYHFVILPVAGIGLLITRIYRRRDPAAYPARSGLEPLAWLVLAAAVVVLAATVSVQTEMTRVEIPCSECVPAP